MKIKKVFIYILIVVSILLIAIMIFKLNQKGEKKMESKNVKIEKFEKFVPKNDFDFDFALAKDKGYSSSKENVTLEYLKLQNKYNIGLALFFEDKLSIEQLDSKIKALDVTNVSKTSFQEIDSTESYYQNTSHLNSNYIYLRNNLRIERLKEADVELLKTMELENKTEKEKLLEMISRTYNDVLSVKFNNQKKENYNVIYTNNGEENVNRKTIVFWLSYQEKFDESGNYIDQEKEATKRNNIEKLATEYSLIFSEELNCDVKIFVHDI
ncbi:hypothetical protein OXX45_000137 [Listeria monocytogenes]|nr:hypothetical protein [Listeria monocytogenes]EKE9612635.1 hypothetical protein [Listeria monocytogenes]EKY8198757.1 hypothetical protein [Listeria monocytogenes]